MRITFLEKSVEKITSQKERENIKESLRKLNLDQIIGKISYEENIPINKLKTIEKEYKDFLFLCGLYKNISPTADIDLLWHNHILDTANYDNFCLHTFGKKIHHKPHFQKQNYAQSKKIIPDLIKKTSDIFISEFGYNPFKKFKKLAGCSNSSGNDSSKCCMRCNSDGDGCKSN